MRQAGCQIMFIKSTLHFRSSMPKTTLITIVLKTLSQVLLLKIYQAFTEEKSRTTRESWMQFRKAWPSSQVQSIWQGGWISRHRMSWYISMTTWTWTRTSMLSLQISSHASLASSRRSCWARARYQILLRAITHQRLAIMGRWLQETDPLTVDRTMAERLQTSRRGSLSITRSRWHHR